MRSYWGNSSFCFVGFLFGRAVQQPEPPFFFTIELTSIHSIHESQRRQEIRPWAAPAKDGEGMPTDGLWQMDACLIKVKVR
jgi:hypothetical protein